MVDDLRSTPTAPLPFMGGVVVRSYVLECSAGPGSSTTPPASTRRQVRSGPSGSRRACSSITGTRRCRGAGNERVTRRQVVDLVVVADRDGEAFLLVSGLGTLYRAPPPKFMCVDRSGTWRGSCSAIWPTAPLAAPQGEGSTREPPPARLGGAVDDGFPPRRFLFADSSGVASARHADSPKCRTGPPSLTLAEIDPELEEEHTCLQDCHFRISASRCRTLTQHWSGTPRCSDLR